MLIIAKHKSSHNVVLGFALCVVDAANILQILEYMGYGSGGVPVHTGIGTFA